MNGKFYVLPLLLAATPAQAQDSLMQAIADAYRTNPTLDAQRAEEERVIAQVEAEVA